VLLLFEPGKMVWDKDLSDNSSGALETLVQSYTTSGHMEVLMVLDSGRNVRRSLTGPTAAHRRHAEAKSDS
jgi:hypothetical protein